MLLRARSVLPISRPAISDGAVLISGERVAAVGSWADLSRLHAGEVQDLGEVILLPGLVNAHCHLDYTDMAGQPPPRRFPDWIKGILARKAASSYADYARAWLRGAAMLLRNGVTSVGDIEAVPELLPEVWSSTPMRVLSFLELTCVKSRRQPEAIVQEASDKISALPSSRHAAALSPHALYSTTPDLLRLVARAAEASRLPVAMHLAESIDEFEMFRHARGPLFEWLNPQRDMSDCGHATPVQLAAACGLFNERFLAIHANYLEPGDIATLARARAQVVHCPRSHAYFGHQPFPYETLVAQGINVSLGTDSLASVLPERPPGPELNLFTEMQTFAAAHPSVPPSEILELATINAARALGWNGKVGQIAEGSLADLIAVPARDHVKSPEEQVLHYAGPLAAVMIGGQWMPAGS
jgi:cytosine/adenosine deaminase-related metal-dependent hydrolase